MSAEHSRTVLRLYRQLLQTARCLDSEGPYKILTAERDLRVLLATRVTHSFRANKDLVDPEAIRLATMHAEETLKDAHALFNNTHTQEYPRMRNMAISERVVTSTARTSFACEPLHIHKHTRPDAPAAPAVTDMEDGPTDGTTSETSTQEDATVPRATGADATDASTMNARRAERVLALRQASAAGGDARSRVRSVVGSLRPGEQEPVDYEASTRHMPIGVIYRAHERPSQFGEAPLQPTWSLVVRVWNTVLGRRSKF
eukprot:TRINITY_DN4088_c0_g1_i2.p1 TRINITY_DN4088_c0_g1~~TRINITY_DN4088_c0_g1_i2.p1  ORF type:complete len:258 (-),score=26.96 TRINITY_DN4088_c0_g1_i2:7-780(-)